MDLKRFSVATFLKSLKYNEEFEKQVFWIECKYEKIISEKYVR